MQVGSVHKRSASLCQEDIDPRHRHLSGSNVIVAGTAIFNAEEPEKVIAVLKSTVDKAQAKIAAKKA